MNRVDLFKSFQVLNDYELGFSKLDNYYNDLTSERFQMAIASMLDYQHVSQKVRELSMRKLMLFSSLIEGLVGKDETKIVYNRYIEHNITITFSKHQDIKLSLDYMVDNEDENFEEAFLQYRQGGVKHLTNGTMYEMVELLKSLL